MKINDFEKETKYKLFRSVKELLHPSISKKNISDYRIVIDEESFPIIAFYPKKVSNIKRIMVFIHGDGDVTDCKGSYAGICKKIATNTNSLILGIDYEIEKKKYKEAYNKILLTINKILDELKNSDIEILLVGDSTGAHIIAGLHHLSSKKINVSKEILFYPVLSMEYFGESKYESINKQESFNENLIANLQNYFNKIASSKDFKDELLNPLTYNDYINYPKTLILTGKVDCLLDEDKDYITKLNNDSILNEVAFASHGFLRRLDSDIEKEVFEDLNKFLQ